MHLCIDKSIELRSGATTPKLTHDSWRYEQFPFKRPSTEECGGVEYVSHDSRFKEPLNKSFAKVDTQMFDLKKYFK